MGHDKVSDHWNENASAWVEASKNGYDIWRDQLNTPAFIALLPDIKESIGLDIGCGDGHNSKQIAAYCKKLICIDISDKLLDEAKKELMPDNLTFQKENAAQLSFKDDYFNFIVATMSFMDMAEMSNVLAEVNRVLMPSGFLQFSIIHPCFNEHKGTWIVDDGDNSLGFLMKDYFVENQGEIHEWKHKKSPKDTKPFRVPRFSKPLHAWVNLLSSNGFYIETLAEPYANDQTIEEHPELISTRVVAHSLIIRCRKHQQSKFNDEILRKLPGNVWWKDKNLVYLGCNDNVLNAFEHSSIGTCIGKKDHDLWPEEIADKLLIGDLQVLDTGKTVTIEETILLNGEKKVMLTNKSPLFDEHHQIIGILGTSTDITDRKKMEEELRIANAAAEAASLAKSAFIANISHDTRTPLTGVIGLSLALEEPFIADDKRIEYAKMIQEGGEKLLEFSESILDDVTADAMTEDKILHESFDVRNVFYDVITLERPTAEVNHLDIQMNIDPAIPPYLMGDRLKLHRIILNLAGNAIKFTPKGGIELNARLFEIKNDEAIIEFSVKDTGIGIAPENQSKIFDQFFKISHSYKTLYTGYGLGLHIVQKFVSLMGGKIRLESELGVGTTFSFVLTMKIGEKPMTIDEVLRQNQSEILPISTRDVSTSNKIQVLLIEDNKIAMAALTFIMQPYDVQVNQAFDAEIAYDLVKSQHFDLIITDVELPEKQGNELTRMIRSLEKEKGRHPTVIIGYTGHTEVTLHQTYMDAGMNAVYTKPITTEKLKRLMSTYAPQALSKR